MIRGEEASTGRHEGRHSVGPSPSSQSSSRFELHFSAVACVFLSFSPPSPDRWMTPCFLSHSPPSPPPFCPHLWLLPSAVLPCLPCFTLHPRWVACSSCIMYECPFVSRGAGAIVKQSKFRWLILKAEKRREKKLALTYCCLVARLINVL